MKKKEKEILMDYLYPTEVDKKIMVDELNEDLKKILPSELCICNENRISKNREKNYRKYYLLIRGYLDQHEKIFDHLENMYGCKNIDDDIIDDLIISFTFLLTQTNDKYKRFDIFKNKKSICFRDYSQINAESDLNS